MEWTTFWTAASAIFTAATAAIAAWALFQWKKQEQLKVRMQFKKAISDYAQMLIQMPPNLSSPNVRNFYSAQANALTQQLGVCNFSWLMMEGMLLEDTELVGYWNFIFANHQSYLSGDIESHELGERCMGIITKKFVFI